LQEAGIDMDFENEIEVHPVSAKKGYGIDALLKRIFQLRRAQSNVYFIGNYPRLLPLRSG
jgi:translation initiation factor IF-2